MWPNMQETTDLVTFTEKIVNGKLHFLCIKQKENKISCHLMIASLKSSLNSSSSLFYSQNVSSNNKQLKDSYLCEFAGIKEMYDLFFHQLIFLFAGIGSKIQKQPPRGVLKKRCSENMQQICRSTAMPKCDFNKFAWPFW